eukprot:2518814-Prymnesium_polylepis.1
MEETCLGDSGTATRGRRQLAIGHSTPAWRRHGVAVHGRKVGGPRRLLRRDDGRDAAPKGLNSQEVARREARAGAGRGWSSDRRVCERRAAGALWVPCETV